MKCTYCGAALPENANFCMGCGRPQNPTTARPPAAATAPASGGSSKAKWLGLGVGLLLLIALAFVIGTQSGLFTQAQVKKPEGPSVLEAQPPKVEGPSVLEAQPPKIEGPSVAQAEAPKPPPQHVVDWLEHLRRTEEMRVRDIKGDISVVVGILTDSLFDSVEDMKDLFREIEGTGDGFASVIERRKERLRKFREEYQKHREKWIGILQFFRSKQPPPECRVLADAYYSALSAEIVSVTELMDAFAQAQDEDGVSRARSTLRNLSSARSESERRFALADEELARVCQSYGIRKYFSIDSQGLRAPIDLLFKSFGISF